VKPKETPWYVSPKDFMTANFGADSSPSWKRSTPPWSRMLTGRNSFVLVRDPGRRHEGLTVQSSSKPLRQNRGVKLRKPASISRPCGPRVEPATNVRGAPPI